MIFHGRQGRILTESTRRIMNRRWIDLSRLKNLCISPKSVVKMEVHLSRHGPATQNLNNWQINL
jgi:hypothetical protein